MVDRKKSRFTSIDQEAASLADLIFDWNLDSDQKIDWAQNRNLIAHIEQKCSFKEGKEFFKEMFTPY